jgi:hypothetical protein
MTTDNGNDRNCKRSAVMRVCTTGEGSGSGLGAGGSGNEAGGGEMERVVVQMVPI